MPYAVMQESLDPPTREQLAKAFAAVPTLTRIDGCTQSGDCYGIVMGGLELDHAKALCDALGALGVRSFVVDETELPVLAPAVICLRADPLPEALWLFDSLNRAEDHTWDSVLLVAAGLVKFPDRRASELLLDLMLRDGRRFRIPARRARYGYMGERRAAGWRDNFCMLVRDIVTCARGAIVARGAEMLARDPPAILAYPKLHGFEEETVWHLWAFGGRRGPDAPAEGE